MYLIKLLSILFDILLAWAAMLLVGKLTKCPKRQLLSFLAVLILPTVYLNGAAWGQCDSIYVSFILLGIYFALDDKPALSMISIAISFGFKLQAVFVMPVYIVLWMYKKFNWKHFLLFPLTYVLLIAPVVLLGRPFMETLTLYTIQTSGSGDALNGNSASIFSILTNVQNEGLAKILAIVAAFAFMFFVFVYAFIKRKYLSDKAIVFSALLLALGIPFLLPHMHERYFYPADILALILAFSYFKAIPLAVLVQFASLLTYAPFLLRRTVLNLGYAGGAIIIALVLSFMGLKLCFEKTKKESAPA